MSDESRMVDETRSLLITHHSSLSTFSWSKPVPVFTRDDKRFDHLGVDEITVELIQFAQPEIVTGIVSVGAGVWITSQVTEVLHQHKSVVFLQLRKRSVFSEGSHRASPFRGVCRVPRAAKLVDVSLSLCGRRSESSFSDERVDELRWCQRSCIGRGETCAGNKVVRKRHLVGLQQL